MLDTFEVNGAIPLTKSSLIDTMTRLQEENNAKMLQEFQNMLPNVIARTADEDQVL